MVRVIRELGLPQTGFAQVLLAVDGRHIPPSLLAELLVYCRIKAPDLHVGLFDVDDRGVSVEELTQREGLDPAVDEDDPAIEPEGAEVLERFPGCFPFAGKAQIFLALARLAPIPCQLEAGVDV